jgi:uncharacterized phiE125 gp8 family phage protein
MIPSAAISQLVTAPAIEPITLAQAKEHLRVDGSDEDSLITLCITAARDRIENECRRAFVRQRWIAYITGDMAANLPVELPRARLMAAETFLLEYRNAAGTWTAWADNIRQAAREPALLWITEQPDDVDVARSPQDAVWRATFWSGYGSLATDVPGPLRHAILLYTAHLFERREMVISGATVTEIPKSLDWLIDSFRVPWEGAVK